MKLRYIIGLVVITSSVGCQIGQIQNSQEIVAQGVSTDLEVDHFNMWVKDPMIAKKQLVDLGFTAVPDSLSDVHAGQGTAGRYFYFLNGYFELIFVYNEFELEENNKVNEDLDFVDRANFIENGASPFGVALKVKDYDVKKIPFEKVEYHQEWMDTDVSIYSAKSSKLHLKEPSVFVVYPAIQSPRYEALADLMSIPDEYSFLREFYKHPNGAQRITNIVITSPGIDLSTETMSVLTDIDNLIVKEGSEHLMELYFDDNIQGKSFDLRPQLPLKLYL